MADLIPVQRSVPLPGNPLSDSPSRDKPHAGALPPDNGTDVLHLFHPNVRPARRVPPPAVQKYATHGALRIALR